MKKVQWIIIGLLTVVSLASIGLSIYTYASMPSRIAEYVSQHRSEFKGEKGDKGEDGADGINGRNGLNGSSDSSGGFNCTTYGINNQFTSCN